MLKVVVLVSGGGTNLQAIIDGVKGGVIRNTKIVGVISNNKNAYALERARENHIPAKCISPKDYESRDVFNEKLLEAVNEYEPDLIVLAGFLVVIPPEMIAAYRNRMINIHPSLIPATGIQNPVIRHNTQKKAGCTLQSALPARQFRPERNVIAPPGNRPCKICPSRPRPAPAGCGCRGRRCGNCGRA